MNIVIMAGGGGTRLWPLSRRNNPKQFLDLGSGKTLIEHTYDRACQLTAPANIFIATNKDYASRIQELFPLLAPDNIFLEPAKRDTAPAFAAAAVKLQQRGQEAEATIFMWSDHVFTDEAKFVAALKKIPQLVAQHPAAIIIMGHRPVFAETGLGYIEVGLGLPGEADVYQVKAFKEKPNQPTAESYVAAGNFFWNMAYISTTPDNLLRLLRAYEPALMRGVDQYAAALTEANAAAAAERYEELPSLAIDYALLERASEIIAVTGDWGWSDVGYWSTVQEIFGDGAHQPSRGYHLHVSSTGCYVHSATNQAVTLLGVNDVIVVVTPDAILVTRKDQAHKIKDIVARLEKDKKHDLL